MRALSQTDFMTASLAGPPAPLALASLNPAPDLPSQPTMGLESCRPRHLHDLQRRRRELGSQPRFIWRDPKLIRTHHESMLMIAHDRAGQSCTLVHVYRLLCQS